MIDNVFIQLDKDGGEPVIVITLNNGEQFAFTLEELYPLLKEVNEDRLLLN